MSLTKEQVKAANQRKITPVEIPEWGGRLYVRSLTVREQIELEAERETLEEKDTVGWSAITLAFQVCNEDGTPFMTLPEAREMVPDLDAGIVARLMKAGGEFNKGITEKSVEAAAKN